jgi:hypothetical protein
MIGPGYDPFRSALPDNPVLNSPFEILQRDGMRIITTKRIQGNNDSYKISVFKLNGAVRVVNQYAEIMSIVALTNMTSVYADLWADTGGAGTVIQNLTANALDLSGVGVGSLFTKNKDNSESYTSVNGTNGGINEVTFGDDIGVPFDIVQKYEVDTFIRFNYTTNAILDFIMTIFFKWIPLNGGTLELVG